MEEIAYRWNQEKNLLLKRTRGIGFEDVVDAIKQGKQLADIGHPNPAYARQRLLVVEIGGYAIVVPYVSSEGALFLKTLYPDRKATRRLITKKET